MLDLMDQLGFFPGKWNEKEPPNIGTQIGILGGTFDPVHVGHLAVAEEAQKKFNLDSVLFIPAAQPPHKLDYIISSFKDRVFMLEQAIASRSDFFISRLEAERQGPSYSIDTLTELRNFLGKRVRFYFIIGMDAFVEIASWKQYDRLLHFANFAVVDRPTQCLERLAEVVQRNFNSYTCDVKKEFWSAESVAGKIYPMAMEPVPVSSTQVRELVKKGEKVTRLVPEKVAEYIKEKGLYL